MHWSRCFVSNWYTAKFHSRLKVISIKRHCWSISSLVWDVLSMCLLLLSGSLWAHSWETAVDFEFSCLIFTPPVRLRFRGIETERKLWKEEKRRRKEWHCWHDRERELQQTVVLYNIWMNVLYNIVAETFVVNTVAKDMGILSSWNYRLGYNFVIMTCFEPQKKLNYDFCETVCPRIFH